MLPKTTTGQEREPAIDVPFRLFGVGVTSFLNAFFMKTKLRNICKRQQEKC